MNIQPPDATILVTGATGFVGAYVARDLIAAGYRVKALRRSSDVPKFIDPDVLGQVEWIKCDILDIPGLEDAVAGADAIIHCAAKVSYHKQDRQLLYKTNIEGTANIVNVAIAAGTSRFIHVSSIAAIGRKKNGGLTDEETPWSEEHGQTAYANSKFHGEMEVWRGIGEGLNAVIVNPSTILGYGDWNFTSTAIFKNVYNEFPWYTNGMNGFVDVEDVSKAILRLLESPIESERFILNGANLHYRELFNMIADGFGRKRPQKNATPMLAGFAWRFEKLKSWFAGKRPLLTKETAEIAQRSSMFDNNKILEALPGFAFTPMEQTILKACKQYQS